MTNTIKTITATFVGTLLAIAIVLTLFPNVKAQVFQVFTANPDTQTSVEVSHATSTQLVAGTSARQHLLVCNNDADTVHVAIGEQATTNHIPLAQNGCWTFAPVYNNNHTRALNAISTGGATSTVSVVQW